MATGDILGGYANSATITTTLASLASDTNMLAGRASAAVDNGTNKYRDYICGGKVRVGTTPTNGSRIEIWVVPILEDGGGSYVWPDTFGGSDANVTATSAGVLRGYAKLAATLTVDSTTSNRDYPFEFSVRDTLGGSIVPKAFQLFFVHNTGAALNASSHSVKQTGLYDAVSA